MKQDVKLFKVMLNNEQAEVDLDEGLPDDIKRIEKRREATQLRLDRIEKEKEKKSERKRLSSLITA